MSANEDMDDVLRGVCKSLSHHILTSVNFVTTNNSGNYYGTSVDAVASVQKQGQICVLDIDAQGVRNVKKSDLEPHYLFIAPPSMAELEKRLRGRGTEKEESIQKRLANAKAELEYGQTTGEFDKYLVNSDLESTFEELVDTFRQWYPSLTEVAPDDEPKKNCNAKCAIS